MLKIAMIQLNIRCDDKCANYDRAETLLRQAADADCDVAILPEVFDTGFSQHVVRTAATGGNTREFLDAMAADCNLSLVAGIAEPADAAAQSSAAAQSGAEQRCRNVAVAFDRNGHLLAAYCKIHPFSFTGEDRFFVSGNRLVTCAIEGISTALFVCYDLRFPEIFRRVARDAQMMIVPANWPTSRQPHWEALLKARAIENQCVIIGVNRTGTNLSGLQFPGASRIYGPFGEEIPSRSISDELLIAEIDITEVARIRRQFPFLQDMRAVPTLPSMTIGDVCPAFRGGFEEAS